MIVINKFNKYKRVNVSFYIIKYHDLHSFLNLFSLLLVIVNDYFFVYLHE